MFKAISASTSCVGSGRIIMNMTATSRMATARSLRAASMTKPERSVALLIIQLTPRSSTKRWSASRASSGGRAARAPGRATDGSSRRAARAAAARSCRPAPARARHRRPRDRNRSARDGRDGRPPGREQATKHRHRVRGMVLAQQEVPQQAERVAMLGAQLEPARDPIRPAARDRSAAAQAFSRLCT